MGLAARALGPAFLLLGVVLLAEAVATGQASLSVVLIVPVVSGSSPTLLGGVASLLLGIFLLPLSFGDGGEGDAPPAPTPASAPGGAAAPVGEGGSGGLVLIGPVPIFFGSWARTSPRNYWLAVLAGFLLLGLALLLAALLV